MQRLSRLARVLARRPRPASVLAAGVAVITLGALGAIGATDATPADFLPKPAPSPAVTTPNPTEALPGDDNRDGVIDEDESGWDCHRMGNRVCGPQRDANTPQR